MSGKLRRIDSKVKKNDCFHGIQLAHFDGILQTIKHQEDCPLAEIQLSNQSQGLNLLIIKSAIFGFVFHMVVRHQSVHSLFETQLDGRAMTAIQPYPTAMTHGGCEAQFSINFMLNKNLQTKQDR
jgi:hypothetical protein